MMIATATKNKKRVDTNFFAEIIAAIDCTGKSKSEIPLQIAANNQPAKDEFFETRGMLQSFRPEQSISQKLDAMIETGASFDVAEYEFEVIGGERLTETDRQYLTANKMPVLCTLHQRLLMKYLFYDSTELLENFAFHIFERESILAEENELYTYEIYFETVSDISRKWFASLLDWHDIEQK